MSGLLNEFQTLSAEVNRPIAYPCPYLKKTFYFRHRSLSEIFDFEERWKEDEDLLRAGRLYCQIVVDDAGNRRCTDSEAEDNDHVRCLIDDVAFSMHCDSAINFYVDHCNRRVDTDPEKKES